MQRLEVNKRSGFTESRVAINTNTLGDNTIIAASSGRVIRIYKLVLWVEGDNRLIIKDSATAINGAGFDMPAQSMWNEAFDNDHPLELGSGNAFVLNLGSASQVSGWVQYTQVG